jgi:DNA end-binding protein Ku
MRAIWSGAISFGMVNIPVKLYSAVEESSLNLHMLAKEDLSPIKFKRVAASDGREVDYKDIVKGYEIEKDRYVLLEESDFERASAEKSRAIEIHSFVEEQEVDSVYFDKPYYLEPEKSASKAYALLREALKETGKVGVAAYVMRNKEHIAILKVSGDVIVLNQIRYQSEVRDTSELNLPSSKDTDEKEVELAIKLINQLSDPFNPEDYEDTYKEELLKVIEAKAKGKVIEISGEAPSPTKVKDLMAALKESLATSKSKSDKQRPAEKRSNASSKKVSNKKKK